MAPSWTHDGTQLWIANFPHAAPKTAADSTAAQVCAVAADTGEVGRCVAISAAVESADGRFVSVPSLAIASPRINGPMGATEKGVYFVGYPDAGKPPLFMVDHGASALKALTRLPEMAWPGVAVSRDGSRVIYAHADLRAANIGGVVVR